MSVFYLFSCGNELKHKHGVMSRRIIVLLVNIHNIRTKGLHFCHQALSNNHTCSYIGPSNKFR